MRDGVAAELTARLRSLSPAAVRVYADASDTPARTVGVPHGRKRWSHVVETIEARPWVRVEFLDAKDRILGELAVAEDEAPEAAPAAAPIVTREDRFLDLLIRAQAAATKDSSAAIAQLGQVVRIMAEAQRTLYEQYTATLQMISDRDAALRERADRGAVQAQPEPAAEEPGMMELLRAAPQMMQMLAMMSGGGARAVAAPAPTPEAGNVG